MKPKILITNDDGVMAPGIRHLAAALSEIADLTIVAPFTEQSGTGMGITIFEPLHMDRFEWSCGRTAWGISGKPADCVKLALHTLFDRKPDMIVSGINRGSNAGRNIYYSGTCAAVIEGVLQEIPGIALSCCGHSQPNYALAASFAPKIVSHFLKNPFPKGTFLNINFPECGMEEVKGIKFAKQGRQFFAEKPDKRTHPFGDRYYYWLGMQIADFAEPEEGDVHLLNNNFISVVPIDLSDLTNHQFIEDQKHQFESEFNQLLPSSL